MCPLCKENRQINSNTRKKMCCFKRNKTYDLASPSKEIFNSDKDKEFFKICQKMNINYLCT